MNWPIRWIVDLFNRLAAWYYRRKFGAAARHLGRTPDAPDGRRGFIILEIDGLGYPYLRLALKQGCMPYLARLVAGTARSGERTPEVRLGRWHSGLPSTTPASQAGILYGNNWDIPGFRWYDKETQKSILCKSPGSVRAIQERISAGRAGLLRGGSSYTNLFDGDARLALFTLSAVGRERFFENVRGVGFLILFFLSLVRVTRIVVLSLWTWLVYVVKHAASLVRRGTGQFSLLGPLLEIANNIIFREITTFCVSVDIYRGMPAIYAAYTGYDEIAHHFGADSREAFRALRGIDKQIRQIDRVGQFYAQASSDDSRKRDYDLYILSDHGMTPSRPFHRRYGQSLEQLIAEHTGREVSAADVQQGQEAWSAARVYYLLDELRGLEDRPHRPLTARLLRSARLRLERRWREELQEPTPGWDLSRLQDIVVRSSGSLSHVYCNITPRQMDIGDLVLLYPGLLEALVDHPGIGLVVGREGERVLVAGKPGAVWLAASGQKLPADGADPLTDLADPDWAAGQLARLARFPHAGDLILLGAWDGEILTCFEEQVASHGGLGGPQDWAFLGVPAHAEIRLATRGIQNAEEVYVRLVQIYGDYQQAPPG